MLKRHPAGTLLVFLTLAAGVTDARQKGAPEPAPALGPQALARAWDAEHLALPSPPLVRHADVEARLRAFREASPDLFQLEEIGRSVEGRSLNHLWFGRGALHVLLWSQMHGDEPTASSALLDLAEHVRLHRTEPAIRRLLETLTVHAVPMLNPDGAERFQRRNAQGIDVNRDALALQSPEGRALKALRDRLNPSIGFNLHNQSWRTSVGRTGRPASISLLAVAYDEARSDNAGRVLAKKLCAVVRDALEPFAAGQIARYDDAFEVRAFGDNLTKWGTSVVLIETGAWPSPAPDPALVRLNFIALLSALDALASGRAASADPARYETLPMNDAHVFPLLIKNATIVTGTGVAPFTGDIGIVTSRSIRDVNGTRQLQLAGRIEDLGDLRVFGGVDTIDATGLVAAPMPDRSPYVGDRLRLPEGPVAPNARTIAVGQPAELMLLKPAGQDGVYRVERVVAAGMR